MKQGEKRLAASLTAMFAFAALFCCLAVFFDPFGFELYSTYSNGIVTNFLRANSESISVDLQNLIYISSMVVVIAAGYCFGSMNFAITTSRCLYGDDIRKYGSKNAGMTNMFRVYGKRGGIPTLAGDALKTAAAVFFGRFAGGENMAYIAALFCVLGHIAPVKYGFKGGKGVLCSAVAILCLDPLVFSLVFAAFALTFLIWRYVSLASVIGAFVYPAALYYTSVQRLGTPPQLFPMIFALFVGISVIFMHRANLKRIQERTESKVDWTKIFRKRPKGE